MYSILRHIKFAKNILSYDWGSHKPQNNLTEDLKTLYELEYKYNIIKNYEFKGQNPKRYNNLLRKFEDNIKNVAKSIASKILIVFENWLYFHNVENPKEWADIRVEEIYENSGDTKTFILEMEDIIKDYIKSGFDDVFNKSILKYGQLPKDKSLGS